MKSTENKQSIIYFRKTFNPRTGFTKHILSTNDSIAKKKYLVVNVINCSDEERKAIEKNGYTFIIRPTLDDLAKLDASYAEIHGGLLTIFTFYKYLAFFREVPLIIYIHSCKFKLRDLKYLKFKDLFLERQYTADGAFLLNALVPIRLYLVILKKVLKLTNIVFGIASEKQSVYFRQIFRKYGYHIRYIPSGVSNFYSKKRQKSQKPRILCTFSRAQLVRGIDVAIESMRYISANDIKLSVDLLPDISSKKILDISKRTNDKRIEVNTSKVSVEEILEKGDVFIFLVRSMRTIPFQPLTVIEALSTGKPVLASNIPQMRELQKRYKNLTIVEKYKDPIEVAKAINSTMKSYSIVDVDNTEYEWGNIQTLQQELVELSLGGSK